MTCRHLEQRFLSQFWSNDRNNGIPENCTSIFGGSTSIYRTSVGCTSGRMQPNWPCSLDKSLTLTSRTLWQIPWWTLPQWSSPWDPLAVQFTLYYLFQQHNTLIFSTQKYMEIDDICHSLVVPSFNVDSNFTAILKDLSQNMLFVSAYHSSALYICLAAPVLVFFMYKK